MSVISAAFNSREIGHPALAPLAAASNASFCAPGERTVVSRWTFVTVH